MVKLDQNTFDIGLTDTLSAQDTWIHRLDPRAKLLTTLIFITTVVSFGKYEISAMIPFFIYPVVLGVLGNLPPGYLIKKVAVVSPFAIMIGIFNPLFDREVLFYLGELGVSGGWISFFSILLKFSLTVSAALTLIALTGFNAVCLALEKLGAPKVFVVQLLFLHRYMFVLIEEALRMVRARTLRAFGTSVGIRSFGPMVGHLLLRSLDRAQRIHLAMSCRGFEGQIHIRTPLKIGYQEILFVLCWSSSFIFMRAYNLPFYIGNIITEYLI